MTYLGLVVKEGRDVIRILYMPNTTKRISRFSSQDSQGGGAAGSAGRTGLVLAWVGGATATPRALGGGSLKARSLTWCRRWLRQGQ